ncbi:HEPN domain-containing protein [Acidianus sp. RZ1]|uniref:HEPN domain-containing protein n=1 Tax=Acidianus sp. RZ1 TaxID=1540082 RepID=UPI001492F1E2|nr:HEPN domain-containing protein [Acidianus sp. RZ1]
MSWGLPEKLKRRALRLFEEALDDKDKGYYDISSFHCEQAVQLYVKAVLLELIGKEYEGHGIRSLLSYLSDLLEKNEYHEEAKKVRDFVRERSSSLVTLEDSCIEGRYEDVEFSEEDADEMIKLAKDTISMLEEVVRSVKSG